MISNAIISHSSEIIPVLQREKRVGESLSVSHDESLADGISKSLLHNEIAKQMQSQLISEASKYHIENGERLDCNRLQVRIHRIIELAAKESATQFGQATLEQKISSNVSLIAYYLMMPMARCIPAFRPTFSSFTQHDRSAIAHVDRHQIVLSCAAQAFRDLEPSLPRRAPARYKYAPQLRLYSHSVWLNGIAD